MSSLRPLTRNLLIPLGVVVLAAVIVVSLPFVGALAFLVRAVAIVAVPAFIVAVVISPRLRAWLNGDAPEKATAKGLLVPERLMFHPKHGWARPDGRSRVLVGADDLLQRVLGPVREVALPAVGTDVRQGEPLFALASNGRRVEVRAPFSGTVVRTNPELLTAPGLVNTSPYELGWAVRLAPSALASERPALFRFERSRAWCQSEVDRLIELVSGQPAHGVTLQDGGALVDELHRELDDATFERVRAELFE